MINRPNVWLKLFLLGALFVLAGCSIVSNPPRLTTTRTAPSGDPADVLFLPAPTPTGDPISVPDQNGDLLGQGVNPVLTVWVNETSTEHRLILEDMVDVLDAEYGLHMEFVLVDESRLVELVEGAAAVGRLPDVIIHPIEYSAGWAERGILDADLSQNIINQLGAETFSPAVIDVGLVGENKPAIPIDGYKQLILYRDDWFEELNLSAPTDYRSILQGANAIYRSETLSAQNGISSTLLSGLVVPTESELISTHQVFEHFANANNCQLVAETGEVVILTPECMDAYEFYRELINSYSPSDVQTDTSAINAYLAGRTGMIFGSPDILLPIAGLSPDLTPSCPECTDTLDYLAQNSSIQTGLSGRSRQREPTEFGNITQMGFSLGTQPELAASFAEYWFNDGYALWLGVEPARRVPMRLGDAEDSEKFYNLWYTLPVEAGGRTLTDIYGRELTEQLGQGVSPRARWGIASGQGDIIASVYEKNIIAIVLQEMLSGYFSSSQAIVATWERVIEQIPTYPFETEIPNFIPSNDSG